MRPESVAYHEAGHNVARILFTGEPHCLTIDPLSDPDPALSSSRLGSNVPLPLLEDEIVELYAGRAAHLRFAPEEVDEALEASASDEEEAERLLKLVAVSQERDRLRVSLRERARALVQEQWTMIEALATRFLRDRTLSAAEIREVVLTDSELARHRLADEIATQLGAGNESLVRAFRRVRREHFVGPGRWWVSAGRGYRQTPDANPVHIYADVRVALDPDRELNNGRPSVHARWISLLDSQPAEHVVHIGAGTGYYSAILAEVVGHAGHVTAIEIDEGLVERLRINLAAVPQASVMHGDGLTCAFDSADGIYINVGLTHPPSELLDSLRLGGKMLLPLMALRPEPQGAVFLVRRARRSYIVEPIELLRIYPSAARRHPGPEAALAEALNEGGWDQVCSLRRDPHPRGRACWLHSSEACLSLQRAR